MKKITLLLLTGIIASGGLVFSSCQPTKSQDNSYVLHHFEKIQLSSEFYAEGAEIGDINRDENPDIVAGPYWYSGPDFKEKHAFYEPNPFDPLKYSENFIVAIEDLNGDDWKDILIVGFPGEAAYWYQNPQGEDGYWQQHLIHPRVDNESPTFYDLNRDGELELVFHTGGYLGYAQRNEEDPTQPWSFTRISEDRGWGKFTHGFGIGDIDGDGLEDIMKAEGWWKNPGIDQLDSRWQYHEANFGPGGAQMYAYDVDDDGLNDVITTLEAHGWGMAWYRQIKKGGEIQFEKNLIMGDSPGDNPYGVRFAEPHSLALEDMDNDGEKDLVTGKRFWAHGPDGYDFHNNAAVIYWFKLDNTSGGDVNFIPYLIDYNSGAGVEIATGDLTGNGFSDIVTCNKKGTFVFLNRPDTVSREIWHYVQPKPNDNL